MKKAIVAFRNSIIGFLYRNILKRVFFLFDPEIVHDSLVSVGKFLGKFGVTRLKTKMMFGFSDESLEQNVFGLKFKNPIGLSAGFDKNAELTSVIPNVGFGFEEIGSITAYPCDGNAKPRLWRLKKSKGLVVYYGLKSSGSEIIYNRLKDKNNTIPIITNIAMTNCSDNLDISKAISDYEKSFKVFSATGDFFTINVSCPNTSGGQPFMDPQKMDLLLTSLDKIETKKPVFVKISPDISFDEVNIILDILKKHRVDGIICSNLTKNRESLLIKDILPSVGGISGKPVQELSDDLISYIYKREKDRFVIIGVGGVFNAEDAYKKIRKGATLIGLITGMIFEGPQMVSDINLGLTKLIKRDGFSNISEAIGADYK